MEGNVIPGDRSTWVRRSAHRECIAFPHLIQIRRLADCVSTLYETELLKCIRVERRCLVLRRASDMGGWEDASCRAHVTAGCGSVQACRRAMLARCAILAAYILYLLENSQSPFFLEASHPNNHKLLASRFSDLNVIKVLSFY